MYPFSLVNLPPGGWEVPQPTRRPIRHESPPATLPTPQLLQRPQTPAITSTDEEEWEDEEIIVTYQWQQQVDAEPTIASIQQARANMQRSLDVAYDNYRNTLDQRQRNVFYRALGRYRERRCRDRTCWRDDDPYTRYL